MCRLASLDATWNTFNTLLRDPCSAPIRSSNKRQTNSYKEVDLANIIIVDDDPDIRESLVLIVASRGDDVRDAGTGLQALALVKKERPDLVLVDQEMPGMSGLELARHLRADDVPFIFVSSSTNWTKVQEGIDIGALSYFVKGGSPQQLLFCVEAALARGKDQQQRHQDSVINVAVGVIIERVHKDSKEAYAYLRATADAKGLTLEATARQLLESTENLNSFFQLPVSTDPD